MLEIKIDDNRAIYDIILKELRKKLNVFCGYWEGKDQHSESMLDLAVIATINEYGDDTKNIPERPFMRNTIDMNKDRIYNFVDSLIEEILNNKLTAKMAVKRLGLFGVSLIKETIDKANEWATPNSPTTIFLKGSSHPLIDIGDLRSRPDWKERR